jgi:hypothetical protein
VPSTSSSSDSLWRTSTDSVGVILRRSPTD